MLEDLTKRIRTLPPLPKSFHEINQICSSEDGTIEKLAKAIEKDPMLVANLLKAANSPLYGFRREIKSVLQAVSLFGMATTRAMIADVSIKKLLNVDIEPYGITTDEFAKVSNAQGALIKEWYPKVDKQKLDLLFLSSLLQENGKILIADEIVRSDEVVQFRSEIESSINIAQVEQMYVATTTSKVSARIFEHWGFEDLMVKSIYFADDFIMAPKEIKEYAFALKVVKSAIPINSPLSERSVSIALDIVKSEGFDTSAFAQAVENIIERF